MSDLKQTPSAIETFKKVATSKPAKWAGAAVAFYYAMISISLGTAIVLDNNWIEPEEELSQRIARHLDAQPLKDGQCYYVDPSEKTDVTMLEYPDGLFLGGIKLFTPFVDSNRTTHTLGELPKLKTADCSILKEEFKLSQAEAKHHAIEWEKDFMASSQLKESLSNMQHETGLLKFAPSIKPN